MQEKQSRSFFPAILCAEFDSPIDALIALCVPQDDAVTLVTAAWCNGEAETVLTSVDGGRVVAALRTETGRWAACNAFLADLCTTRSEAERRLQRLLKRGRKGMVGVLETGRGDSAG